jgi:hypothetical protein
MTDPSASSTKHHRSYVDRKQRTPPPTDLSHAHQLFGKIKNEMRRISLDERCVQTAPATLVAVQT